MRRFCVVETYTTASRCCRRETHDNLLFVVSSVRDEIKRVKSSSLRDEDLDYFLDLERAIDSIYANAATIDAYQTIEEWKSAVTDPDLWRFLIPDLDVQLAEYDRQLKEIGFSLRL